MKQQCLVLSCNAYSFQGSDGKIVQGASISYFPETSLAPSEDEEALERGALIKGTAAITSPFPYAQIHKVGEIPALYDITLKMVPRKQRNGNIESVVQPVDMDFVATVELHINEDRRVYPEAESA